MTDNGSGLPDSSWLHSPWIKDFVPAAGFDFSLYASFFVIQQLFESMGASPVSLAINQGAYSASYILLCPLLTLITFPRIRWRILIGVGLSVVLLAFFAVNQTPILFQVGLVAMAVAGAMFWPNLQKLIGIEAGNADLSRRVNVFNLGWTTGKALGFVAAGVLVQLNQFRLIFWVLIPLQLLSFALFMLRRERQAQGESVFVNQATTESEPESQTESNVELDFSFVKSSGVFVAALLVNFVTWGSQATFVALIPSIGQSLKITPMTQGFLLGGLVASQGITFLILKRSQRWIGRSWIILTPAICMVCAWFVLAQSPGLVTLFAVTSAMGMSVALSYSNSIFYALSAPAETSVRANIHEAVIGLASLSLPFYASKIMADTDFVAVGWQFMALAICVIAVGVITVLCARPQAE